MDRLRRSTGSPADRGSGSLEFAILSLAFLLLVFMTVQAALYYHARNVVKAEAEAVARTVRAYPAPAGSAPVRALPSARQVQDRAVKEAREQWRVLDDSGDTTSAPQVEAVIEGNQVRVTVSANPILLVPGLFGGNDLTITQTAGGPFEVFKRSGED